MPVEIDVIVAAQNMERYIGETLQSLQDQSFQDFNVLVVNDHSTDRTAQIVGDMGSDDPRFRVIDAAGRGVSAARNQGFGALTAAYVLFLDADDLLTRDALDGLHGSLAPSDAVAALGGIERIDEAGGSLPGADNRALVPEGDQLAGLIRKNYIVNGGALLIRRSAIDAAGGYDPALKYGEDWEFWCRLVETGPLAVTSGPAHLRYRQVGAGANNTARTDFFAGSVPCLDALADRPSLKARYGAGLARMIRARRIDIFWSNVRSEFQFGAKRRALMAAFAGAFRYPESFLKPRLAWRLLTSLARR